MGQSYGWDRELGVGASTWEEQAPQAGLRHDHMAFFPIDGNPRHGLLVINHTYTADGWLQRNGMRQGVSVVEIFERQGQWRVMPRSRHDRGINVPLSRETASECGDPATQPRCPGAFSYSNRLEQQ